MMALGLWWALLPAQAALPLPSYKEELAMARWYEVNRYLEDRCQFDPSAMAMACEEGATTQAIQDIDSFQDTLFHDAGLEYLAGLARKYEGDNPKAVARYRASVALSPTYVAAWYDLGEIYLVQANYDEAKLCFEHVASLREEGPTSWLGPWRLAEVAAHQHQAEAFEAQMRIALERGFSFQQVAGLPNWRGFYADPAMRDSVTKLITVYGSQELLDSLR